VHNQYAGFSQELAEQRMTERRDQAAGERLARAARPPRRRRRRWAAPRWWRPARRPAVVEAVAATAAAPAAAPTAAGSEIERPEEQRVATG
jgi:hypothetical protein